MSPRPTAPRSSRAVTRSGPSRPTTTGASPFDTDAWCDAGAGAGSFRSETGRHHEGDAERRPRDRAPGAGRAMPMATAIAGSRLIRVPNADVVSRRRASSSRREGDDRKQHREAESHQDELPGQQGQGARPGDERRDHARHGQRDGEPFEAGQPVPDMLGEQDVRRPAAGRREGERDSGEVDAAVPWLGQQHHSDRREGGPEPASGLRGCAPPRRPTARGTRARSPFPEAVGPPAP